MICPNKICQKEIPDDSVFCDQCGVRIRQCTNCGNITLSKFCNLCGEACENRIIPESVLSTPVANTYDSESAITQTTVVQATVTESATSSTIAIDAPPELKIVHANFTLNICTLDILGRTTGQHCKELGQFPVISSRHGIAELIENEWYYTDLGSTNKSYLNGARLVANVRVKLNDGDNLVLANIPFSVRIIK